MDDLTGMNDLFVRCWVEGCKDKKETDCHWRCKKGNVCIKRLNIKLFLLCFYFIISIMQFNNDNSIRDRSIGG